MNLYDDVTAATSPPSLPAASTPGYYTEGVAGSVARSIIRAWHLNALQSEIVGLIVSAGLTPSRTDNTQLRQAVNALASQLIATAVAPLATTAALQAEVTARAAAISAAINAVIGGAPGALDTLNELATALNDDANFSATITNLLALKAPLANPPLTGGTTQTQAVNDNSTKLATTAYADRSAANAAGAVKSVGNYSNSAGPWWTWDPSTGKVFVEGTYTAAIASEGPIAVSFPVNIGVYRTSGATILQNSGTAATEAQIDSASPPTSTGMSVRIQDNQGGSAASATGFNWWVTGYSATQPS